MFIQFDQGVTGNTVCHDCAQDWYHENCKLALFQTHFTDKVVKRCLIYVYELYTHLFTVAEMGRDFIVVNVD